MGHCAPSFLMPPDVSLPVYIPDCITPVFQTQGDRRIRPHIPRMDLTGDARCFHRFHAGSGTPLIPGKHSRFSLQIRPPSSAGTG